jgi:hypothetical protein
MQIKATISPQLSYNSCYQKRKKTPSVEEDIKKGKSLFTYLYMYLYSHVENSMEVPKKLKIE